MTDRESAKPLVRDMLGNSNDSPHLSELGLAILIRRTSTVPVSCILHADGTFWTGKR